MAQRLKHEEYRALLAFMKAQRHRVRQTTDRSVARVAAKKKEAWEARTEDQPCPVWLVSDPRPWQ